MYLPNSAIIPPIKEGEITLPVGKGIVHRALGIVPPPPIPLPTPFLHYDAIDNAGSGIHDENSLIWKDLVGSNDATVVLGNGSRAEKGLNLDETKISFNSSGVSVREYTMFVTFTPVFV